MKILIIDDSITIRKILKSAITNINPEVTIIKAKNGREGLEILRADPYIDYVFLDTLMPDISGKELLRTIRLEEELQHTKVIVQTSEHKSEELESLKGLGISGYLIKPFSVSMLTQTLTRWI